MTIFISFFLKNKVLNFVSLDKSKLFGNYNKKNIITFKKHISMNVPLIVLKNYNIKNKLHKLKVVNI